MSEAVGCRKVRDDADTHGSRVIEAVNGAFEPSSREGGSNTGREHDGYSDNGSDHPPVCDDPPGEIPATAHSHTDFDRAPRPLNQGGASSFQLYCGRCGISVTAARRMRQPETPARVASTTARVHAASILQLEDGLSFRPMYVTMARRIDPPGVQLAV